MTQTRTYRSWQTLSTLVFNLVFVLVLLSGCSRDGDLGEPLPGDSGGTSPPPASKSIISGTVAAGSPIVGKVTIKDSSNPAKDKTVFIEANGKYSIDVGDLTPPFMLRAEGEVGTRKHTLYTAATFADINGTVDITPLTDLIVANIAGQVAETVYNNGNFSGMTQAALDAAEADLQARIQPVLDAVGLDASIDLLRAVFNADHTGLDAVLDLLRVTIDPATLQATVLNLINNQQITDDLNSQVDQTVLDGSGVASGLSDFQQIVAQFDTFEMLFKDTLPAENNATLLALFDAANFLNSGRNLSGFLSQITLDAELIGLQFNITMESLTAVTGLVQLNCNICDSDQTWRINKIGGIWLIAGDQEIAEVGVDAFAKYDALGTITTGIEMEINDEGGRGIDYAVVKGEGLPTSTGGSNGISAGALLVNRTSNNSFGLAPVGTVYSGIGTPSINAGHNQFPMLDPEINAIGDGEVYAVELWEDAGTPSNLADDTLLASYARKIGKRPYLNSELSSASFPNVTTLPSAIQAFAIAGGNLTLTWTLPAGLSASAAHFWRSMENGYDRTENDVLEETDTSITFTIGPPTSAVVASGINLDAEDQFRRKLERQVNRQ